MGPLCSAFVADARLDEGDEHGLEARLEEVVLRARAAWPFAVEEREFVAYLGRKLRREKDLDGALRQIRAPDLFLAFACVKKNADALAAFEATYFADIEIAIRSVSRDDAKIDDVRQRLRIKLFVGEGESPPKIGEYSGRGELRSWFRVTAVRQAISEARKTRREVALDDAVADAMPSAAVDPECAYLRSKYAALFQRAFREAIHALSSQERTLLLHHYVDRLTIDQIGAIYRIHRMTAARRLTAVRQKVVETTRERLAESAKLGASELRSILRLVKSEMHISLRRVLRVDS
jgi:RNA polymerase sigma-70 factor (ECF subfamily)